MRFFFGSLLLLLGIGLCALSAFTGAFLNSGPAARSFRQMEQVPVKESYTRAEVAEAVWQAWTNRISLPTQNSYTPEELKNALMQSAHIFGSQQETCDRSGLENAVRTAAGYGKHSNSGGLIALGVILMVIGAFIVGAASQTFAAKRPEHGR